MDGALTEGARTAGALGAVLLVLLFLVVVVVPVRGAVTVLPLGATNELGTGRMFGLDGSWTLLPET